MEASGANNKPKQRQTAIILRCAAPQVLEVYDHFHFEADDDKNDPAKVLEKLEEYCNPPANVENLIETNKVVTWLVVLYSVI